MKNRIPAIIACVLLWTACNRGELTSVRNQMEENAATAERIEQMRQQLVIDFRNAVVFYQAMEKKLYVKDIRTNPDGTYSLFYSDGAEIRLRSGFSPLVAFGEGGEVLINGEPTGMKGQSGTDGRQPVVSIDADGFYWVDGVKTDVKGIPGPAGHSLTVSIDAEGYYCIGGVRVEPNICMKGTDGADGSAPVPTIRWNADAGSFELLINGLPTDPRPTFVSPADGNPGVAGTDAVYIRQVTLSAANELIFTLSDGSQQKSSAMMLRDMQFTLDADRADNVLLDGSRTVAYTLLTQAAPGSVVVRQYKDLPGWKVEIGEPDPVTHKGNITLTPMAGGLTTNGVFFVIAADGKGYSVVRRIDITVASYKVSVPSADNHVYAICTPGGKKIGEICREYNTDAGARFMVAYPYDPETHTYGAGYVTDNGGSVNHSGFYYVAGGNPAVSEIGIYDGSVGVSVMGALPAVSMPESVSDVDGNLYPTVKIGSQYWMGTNLKVQSHNDGSRLLNKITRREWVDGGVGAYWYGAPGVVADYKDTYGAIYNEAALLSGRLAPVGWHIPRVSEWLKLQNYLGGMAAGGKLKSVDLWRAPNVGATNITGFSGLPGGVLELGGLPDTDMGSISDISGSTVFGALPDPGDTGVTSFILDYFNADFFWVTGAGGFHVRCLKD